MLAYPATLTTDSNGQILVTFRDIPEANTAGDDEVQALTMAADALETAMDFYFEDRRAVPLPSKPKRRERLVELPASVSAKVLLLNALVAAGISNAELARRMGTRPQEVQRIVDLNHATKIDTIAAALAALGRHLDIQVT